MKTFLVAVAGAAALAAGCGSDDKALERGLEQLRAGKYNRAARTLRRAASVDPRKATACCNLGIAQWMAGHPEKAADSFRMAVEFSVDPRPWEYLGRVCLELGRDDEVRNALERARAVRPTPACLTAIGALEMRAGRYEAATNRLLSALAMEPGYPPALYNMALATRDRHGAHDLSRAWAGRYLEADPNGPRAGRIRTLFGENAAAQGLGRKPAISRKAAVRGGAGQPRSASKPGPVSPAAQPAARELLAQAGTQAARGNRLGVEELILKARRAEPDNPEVLWKTARLYDTLGLKDRAAAARDLFLREFPDDPRAASVSRARPAPSPEREQPGAAAGASASAPDPRQTAMQLWGEGLKHHKAGELDAAIEYYRKALRADGKLVSASYNLGLAYRTKNDNVRARDAFTAALSVKPDMHDARYMLASCHRSLGETDKAVIEARELLRMDDSYANAHLLLGTIYREQNRPPQAREHLERFLRLDPGNPMADQARGWIGDMR